MQTKQKLCWQRSSYATLSQLSKQTRVAGRCTCGLGRVQQVGSCSAWTCPSCWSPTLQKRGTEIRSCLGAGGGGMVELWKDIDLPRCFFQVERKQHRYSCCTMPRPLLFKCFSCLYLLWLLLPLKKGGVKHQPSASSDRKEALCS